MGKLIASILFITSFMAYGIGPKVTVSCDHLEKNGKKSIRKSLLKTKTLEEGGVSSLVLKPKFSSDNDALYILSLSTGEEYTDSTNEVVGGEYLLNLSRLNLGNAKKIKSKYPNIVSIESRDGLEPDISYEDAKGMTVYKKPKFLSLMYKKGKKLFNLKCEIISLR